MTRLLEFLTQKDGDDAGTILINPKHIVACVATFDKSDLWAGTQIWLVGGMRVLVNASYEQIESAIKKLETEG